MNTALLKLLTWLRSTWRRARVPERSESLFVPPVPPAAIALPSPLAACATVVIPVGKSLRRESPDGSCG